MNERCGYGPIFGFLVQVMFVPYSEGRKDQRQPKRIDMYYHRNDERRQKQSQIIGDGGGGGSRPAARQAPCSGCEE